MQEVIAAGHNPNVPRTEAAGAGPGPAGRGAGAGARGSQPYGAQQGVMGYDPQATPTRSAILSESNVTPGSLG